MTFEELKNKIYTDEKIEFVLQELECHSVVSEQNGSLITAGLPDGNNKRSVQIRNSDGLFANIRSRGVQGSLIDVVAYIKGWQKEGEPDIHRAKEWIMEICEYKHSFGFRDISQDPLDWLKDLKRKRKCYDNGNIEIRKLENTVINQYIRPFFSPSFAADGIGKQTQEEFGICYDADTDRIVIPIRDADNDIVGFKGRATKEEDIKKKIKYIYLYPTQQSYLLFNYYSAKKHVSENNEVIVVESEKGCMQLWDMGVKNCVGLGHKDITRQQMRLLRKLRCDIVLAYDKDVDIEFMKAKYKGLKDFRNVYAIYDNDGLLSEKESPSDKGKDIWIKLYNNRIKLY